MKIRGVFQMIIMGIILVTTGVMTCSPVNQKDESMLLLSADRSFADLSREKGAAEAFREYLTVDAIQLPDGGHPIMGRDSIYAAMQPGQELTLNWDPQQATVAESGELGYTWGTYTFTWQDTGGSTTTSYGKYLNIWRKQDDGNWKVVVDMGNSSPEPNQ